MLKVRQTWEDLVEKCIFYDGCVCVFLCGVVDVWLSNDDDHLLFVL